MQPPAHLGGSDTGPPGALNERSSSGNRLKSTCFEGKLAHWPAGCQRNRCRSNAGLLRRGNPRRAGMIMLRQRDMPGPAIPGREAGSRSDNGQPGDADDGGAVSRGARPHRARHPVAQAAGNARRRPHDAAPPRSAARPRRVASYKQGCVGQPPFVFENAFSGSVASNWAAGAAGRGTRGRPTVPWPSTDSQGGSVGVRSCGPRSAQARTRDDAILHRGVETLQPQPGRRQAIRPRC